MRPLGSPGDLERRRRRALVMLKDGSPPVEVARALGVDRRSVRRWRAAFDREGVEGVSAKPASGRPSKLDARAKQKLERLLLQGAEAHGFPTDLWTCPRVAALIQRTFHVSYHVDHLSRLLRSLGWSPQKPERRARERDEDAIRRWVKKDWPRIKKTPGG